MLTEVLNLYTQLQGVAPRQAEMHYIMEVQQLHGYGLELFTAKVNVMSQLTMSHGIPKTKLLLFILLLPIIRYAVTNTMSAIKLGMLHGNFLCLLVVSVCFQ